MLLEASDKTINVDLVADLQPVLNGNRLLSLLRPDAVDAIRSHLIPVPLMARQVLHHAGGKLDFVYFPEEGMLSLVLNLAEGRTAEVGVVGWEGMSAASLIVGIDRSYTDCIVQIPGRALRMDAWIFARMMLEEASLREVMLRYMEAFNAQVTQSVACNSQHKLDQRLARWLLMAHDRMQDTTIAVTHEFLAMMLGVRRPSVTTTASLLQQKRLIQQMNRRVVILDRLGLEACSCECYEATVRRYETVMAAPSCDVAAGLQARPRP